MRTTHPNVPAAVASVLAIFAFGCADESNRIRFDQLAVGQVSRYAVYDGDDVRVFPEEASSRTLVVEVVDHDDVGFLVRETLVPGPDETDPPSDPVFEYHLRVAGDRLEVIDPGGSWYGGRLFMGVRPPSYPLYEVAANETELDGWVTPLSDCTCAEEGFVRDVEVHGRTYARLNVSADSSEVAGDGPVTTHLFSARDGVVRSSWFTYFGSIGVAYVLLP